MVGAVRQASRSEACGAAPGSLEPESTPTAILPKIYTKKPKLYIKNLY
jgi:hypothetical protein